MRRLFLILTFPLVSLLLAGCGVSPDDVPHLDSPGKTIVCLGDSITSGYGVSPEQAYPTLLGARLGTEVVNLGVSGDTAEDGLARVDAVLDTDPWLVVVELGGNDFLRRIPPERTEAALRQILDRLLAAQVAVVVVELDIPFGGRYAEIYGRVGKDYGVPVLEDTLGDILTDSALKSDDRIHPNAAGHAVLAEELGDELAPILAARRKLGR